MWTIRSFLNTDTPALAKLWNAHHAAVSSFSACPVSVWDACILSKPYFRASELLLALDQFQQVRGFVHFGFAGDINGYQLSKTVGCIHKICVSPGVDEESIAQSLLSEATSALALQGAETCMGLGAGDRSGFYLGVADGDNWMGVLAQDTRTQNWLFEAGFVPVRPTECWELELSSFRPPMDRMQIQARRTCTIGRMIDDDYEHWWTNTALGHCEQIRFHLMIKNPSSLGGQLQCWFPDPLVSGVDSGIVRISLQMEPEGEEQREQYVYLIAESLRQLQQDRKRIVRTVASADRQRTITLLQRLGFRSVDHGLLFQKSLMTA